MGSKEQVMQIEEIMATFACLRCTAHRPYSYTPGDRRVHPLLNCAPCRMVTKHVFVALESYHVTTQLNIDQKIVGIHFSKMKEQS